MLRHTDSIVANLKPERDFKHKSFNIVHLHIITQLIGLFMSEDTLIWQDPKRTATIKKSKTNTIKMLHAQKFNESL